MKKISDYRGVCFPFGVATSIVVIDYLTKVWIRDTLRFGMTIPIIEDFFDLTHIHNPGAAFGILSETHPTFRSVFFVVVLVVAVSILSIMLLKTPQHEKLKQVALSLIIGGAVGNAVNRIEFGYVTDFLSLHYATSFIFPAFNVADIAICVGAAFLLFFNRKQYQGRELE